jgi:hypothetical protein
LLPSVTGRHDRNRWTISPECAGKPVTFEAEALNELYQTEDNDQKWDAADEQLSEIDHE